MKFFDEASGFSSELILWKLLRARVGMKNSGLFVCFLDFTVMGRDFFR